MAVVATPNAQPAQLEKAKTPARDRFWPGQLKFGHDGLLDLARE
jgi:hypothetical protein